MDDLKQFLSDNMMSYQLDELKEKLQDKKVIIYGAGLLFQTIVENYDLADLNIIGICDKKFSLDDEKKDFLGYNIIPFLKLPEYQAEYIIVAIRNYYPVITELKHIIKDINIIPFVNFDFDINKNFKSKNIINKLFSIKNTKYSKEIKILGFNFIIEDKYKKLFENYKNLESKVNYNQQLLNKINMVISNELNTAKIDTEIDNLLESGINETKRDPQLIVSLTSYPERMYDIHYCLYSLLTQSIKPDQLILWLAEEEFPNKEKDIPKKVLNLQKYGLTIKWCNNIKSYKKLVPTLKEYPNDIIVTADDDIFYPKNWLEKLYNEYLQNSEYIYCHNAHKITFEGENIKPYTNWKKSINDNTADFINIAIGCGGILYPPNSFHQDIFDQKLFMWLAPNADDLWFWAMAVLNNKKIKIIKNPINRVIYINPRRELGLSTEHTLYQINLKGGNDLQFKNILEQYPEIKDILRYYHYVFEYYNDDIYNYVRFLDHKFAYDYVTKQIKGNSSILEIGCGDGYGTSILAKHFKQIEAIDISNETIQRAKAIYKLDNCNFSVSTDKKLNFPDNSFDAVISFHVIEHVKNVRKYLKEIKRVLKPDGKFIITTPSRTHRLAPNQKPWNEEHLREYDSKTLKKEIDKVFKNYKVFSITAKQEIKDIEFDRVVDKRADYNGIRKNINTNIDYKKEFSINDFYVSEENPDSGLDLMVTNINFDSKEYWENRYRYHGNSGAGSYGKLAEFKAEIINGFINEHNINNIIEFGCGDGNQLNLFNIKNYLGFDVSDTIIKLCQDKFFDNPNYKFKNMSEYRGEKAELTLSLDVIYHLVEDSVYNDYMNKLFDASNKYVIIYASNKNEEHYIHVKHRKFTDWIENNKKEWKLIKHIPNKYPYNINKIGESSFADFYIFAKS